ncbi:hypothetical protein TRVL_03370 [Trypanosoma vivax]|nr:hypothetical protein TRVL_03370 [Trypanosoma vivax]
MDAGERKVEANARRKGKEREAGERGCAPWRRRTSETVRVRLRGCGQTVLIEKYTREPGNGLENSGSDDTQTCCRADLRLGLVEEREKEFRETGARETATQSKCIGNMRCKNAAAFEDDVRRPGRRSIV